MLDVQNASIKTAGAYVCIDGLYLFAIGIKPHNGNIPVVRLGGHREGSETGWQCAAREVLEEANVHIAPFAPQTTYLTHWDSLEREVAPSTIQWRHKTDPEPMPFLVLTYCHDESMILSLMYLAHAQGAPTPSSEVKGLLLLSKADVHRLCRERITLGQYLDRGGQAIFSERFNQDRVLEPFAQLRLLSRILSMEPGIPAAQQSLKLTEER